jgi:hypothetical protein
MLSGSCDATSPDSGYKVPCGAETPEHIPVPQLTEPRPYEMALITEEGAGPNTRPVFSQKVPEGERLHHKEIWQIRSSVQPNYDMFLRAPEVSLSPPSYCQGARPVNGLRGDNDETNDVLMSVC